ncbi:MAG TPA: hypothetical protein VFR64_20000 [Methylomirabilota bacterium]|nr:hypothetical protein [Methylomirabilota bacterium]
MPDLTGPMCGWSDCNETAPIRDPDTGADIPLPSGWRALGLSKYSLLEPSGVLHADRGMVLCPVHVEALKRLLKRIPLG